MRSNQFQGVAEILAEFQDSDTDLARNLLNLRQEPSGMLQDRVRAIPHQAPHSPDRAPSLPASLRAWGVWRRGVRMAAVWIGAVMLVAATLLAFFPGLRTATAQAVETIGRILVGSSYAPGGFVMFTPAPPFVVKQPNYLPAGFSFVGERYNTGSPAQNDQPGSNLAQPSEVQSPGSVSADGARQAIERDRGREAYIVLGYEAPNGPYMALFERAARPGETLPAGEPRIVANQAAVLQRSGQILTLTWISAGTWLELEGRLPEAELLKVAEGLTVSQTPDATSADATPAGVQSTFFEIPRLSVDEAQKQVS
ncbi:MAG TPA: hypothetical protein VGJ87_23170, partial [Roseiflexaceae bacterium]